MKTLQKVIGALALLAMAGFCAFGFMAAYEYPEASARMPWQAGYGALALICLSGLVFLLRPRRHKRSFDH